MGAGLGLPIARALVHAHGGEISIASGREGGTRVTIRLPLLAADTEPAYESDRGIPSTR